MDVRSHHVHFSLEHVKFEKMTLHLSKRGSEDRWRHMGLELREKISMRKKYKFDQI